MATVTTFSNECQKCGKGYSVNPARIIRSKFCSRICQVSGQVWTDERREKIGKAMRGARESIRGENHYFWKGGAWTYWKKSVRERDEDKCQCVGKCSWHSGDKCSFSDPLIMHVDHIKPKKLFPKLQNDPKNMTTLCPNCHQMKTNEERRNKIFKKK